MPKFASLDDLIDDCRLYSDQRVADGSNAFITDVEITRMLNLAFAEHVDLIVASGGHDLYTANDTISIVGGTASYALPDDFYQLDAVQLEWSSDDHEPVRALNHQTDIWRFAGHTWDRWTEKRYRIAVSNIEFYPTPQSAVTARIYYVPAYLTLDPEYFGLDTHDFVNGWERMIIFCVASEMQDIEEPGSGTKLYQRYMSEKERIQDMADERDAANPQQIRDTQRRRMRYYPRAVGSV